MGTCASHFFFLSFVLAFSSSPLLKRYAPLVVGGELKHLVVVLELEVVCALVFEELWADLLADNLGADKVILCEAQSHLLKNKLCLLPSLHRSVRLNLQLLQNVRSLCVAAAAVEVRVTREEDSTFVCVSVCVCVSVSECDARMVWI